MCVDNLLPLSNHRDQLKRLRIFLSDLKERYIKIIDGIFTNRSASTCAQMSGHFHQVGAIG